MMKSGNQAAIRRVTWTLLGTIVLGTIGFLSACSSKISDLNSAAADSTAQTDYLLALSLPPSDQQPRTDDSTTAAGLLGNLRLRILERSVDSGFVAVGSSQSTVIPYGDGGQFIVEPNSSNWDTTIVIVSTELRIGNLAVVDYTFGPSGMQFSPAAKLVIPARMFADRSGMIPSIISWLYWDQTKGRWVDLGKVEADDDGNFYVDVDHFSKYRGLSQGGQ